MSATIPYRLLNKFTVVISLIGVGVALSDSGFTLSTWLQQLFHIFYITIVILGFAATVGRYLQLKSQLVMNKLVVFDNRDHSRLTRNTSQRFSERWILNGY